MAIVYVLVKGSPLTAEEFDGNFEDLDTRVSAIEDDPPSPVEIVDVIISGTTFSFEMSDATTLGPYTIPSTTYVPAGTTEIGTTTLTLGLAHRQSYLRFTNASLCVVTVPLNSDAAIPTDSEIILYVVPGSGGFVLTYDAGVIINAPSGKGLSAITEGKQVRLKKVAADEWDLDGDALDDEVTTPTAFTFTDTTGATTATVYTSAAITVEGINAEAAISITGTTAEYSINGGTFTDDAGTVQAGDSVRARITSSGSGSATVNAVVTIGGVSDTYSVTTA